MFPTTTTHTRAFEVAPALIAALVPPDSDVFLALVAIVGVAFGRNRVVAFKNTLSGQSSIALKTYVVLNIRFISPKHVQVCLRLDDRDNCRWETLKMHANKTSILMLSRSDDGVVEKGYTVPIDFSPSVDDKAAVWELLDVMQNYNVNLKGVLCAPSSGATPADAATTLMAIGARQSESAPPPNAAVLNVFEAVVEAVPIVEAQVRASIPDSAPAEEAVVRSPVLEVIVNMDAQASTKPPQKDSEDNNKRARDEQASNLILDTLKATYGFKTSVPQVVHGFMDACAKNHVDRMELIGAFREVYSSVEPKRPKTREEIVSFLREFVSSEVTKQMLWDELFTAEEKGELALAFIAQKLH